MNSPTKLLNSDPLAWLLEPENPSVRYWTLVDILDCPASDGKVQNAREAILQEPLVQELFQAQRPAGHWGEDPAKPHTAQGSLGVLSLLYTLGVAPNEHTLAGCHSFLQFCQNENGGFSVVKTQRSGIFPCTTGEHLPMLAYFGLGEDPRLQRAFLYLIDAMSGEAALDCGRYQHRDCLWGAIATLRGLNVLPPDMRSPKSERLVARMAEALLEADYDFDGEHKRWLTFGVPRAWDLLSALNVLALHGYGRAARFQELAELILARQDEHGRWLCGSTSRTWPLEKRNRPSKWVTLDVLRLFKRAGWLHLAGDKVSILV